MSPACKQVKGADVPFEDEKFSYLALTRHLPAHRPAARVLASPHISKVGVTAKVCGAGGGGCVVFFVEPDARERVAEVITDLGARVLPFRVDRKGLTVTRPSLIG